MISINPSPEQLGLFKKLGMLSQPMTQRENGDILVIVTDLNPILHAVVHVDGSVTSKPLEPELTDADRAWAEQDKWKPSGTVMYIARDLPMSKITYLDGNVEWVTDRQLRAMDKSA